MRRKGRRRRAQEDDRSLVPQRGAGDPIARRQPTRAAHWPFRESLVPGRGVVRNVPPGRKRSRL